MGDMFSPFRAVSLSTSTLTSRSSSGHRLPCGRRVNSGRRSWSRLVARAARPGRRRPRRRGARPSSLPGTSSFERRTPEPITATSISSTRRSRSSRHSAGQPDRRDPAVLHRRLLDRAVHGEERRLAHVERPLDEVVHVGAGVGTHEAGGDPLLAVAPARDHDAVGAGVERHVVRLGQAAVSASAGSISATRDLAARGQAASAAGRRAEQVGVVEGGHGLESAEAGDVMCPSSSSALHRGAGRSLPVATPGAASAGSHARALVAHRSSSGTAAPAATGPSTRSRRTGWRSGWVPTTSSPTSSRPRTASSSPGTRTRSAAPPTWPTTPEFADRRDHEGDRRPRGDRLVHRGLHPRRAEDAAGQGAAAASCGPGTPGTTGRSRSRPWTRCCGLVEAGVAARGGARSVSTRRPSTRRTSTRSGCRWRSRCCGRCGDTAWTALARRCSSSPSRPANLRALSKRTRVPLVQLIDAAGAPYDFVAAVTRAPTAT